MTLSEIERAPLSAWEVENLRATTFFAPSSEIKPESWWQDVVQAQPESQVIRPQLGQRQEQGFVLGGQLTLRVSPSRVDWLLAPKKSEPEEPSMPLTVGQFLEVCPKFTELVSRWFQVSPSPTRLAFGAVTLLPVPDRVQGYRQLSAYLPTLKIDPEGSSDFLYRINRRRKSTTPIKDLQLNRLSNWSVSTTQLKRIEFTGSQENISGTTPVFSCRIEVDVNTAPEDSRRFTGEQCVIVFQELTGLASEIIEKGDIP